MKLTKILFFTVFFFCFAHAQMAEEYFESGGAKYNLKNYAGAIEDYTKVIDMNPNNVSAYVMRGYSKLLNSKIRSACKDFKKAKELGYSETSELIKKYCN